jgi:hypothetical protein
VKTNSRIKNKQQPDDVCGVRHKLIEKLLKFLFSLLWLLFNKKEEEDEPTLLHLVIKIIAFIANHQLPLQLPVACFNDRIKIKNENKT